MSSGDIECFCKAVLWMKIRYLKFVREALTLKNVAAVPWSHRIDDNVRIRCLNQRTCTVGVHYTGILRRHPRVAVEQHSHGVHGAQCGLFTFEVI